MLKYGAEELFNEDRDEEKAGEEGGAAEMEVVKGESEGKEGSPDKDEVRQGVWAG